MSGRLYGREWSLENVARLLRYHAGRGFLLGQDPKADARYRQSCTARHAPTQTSVIFTRDNLGGSLIGWHASLCFIGINEYLPWDEETAGRWLRALYGDDLGRVVAYGHQSTIGEHKGARHYLLPVEGW
jgi:hypothetical protein